MSGHGVMPGSYDFLRVSELAPGQTVEIKTTHNVKLWLTKPCGAEERRDWVYAVSLHVSGGDLTRASRTNPQNLVVRDAIALGEIWPIVINGKRMSTPEVMQITVEC